jgi:hypothetical protein
MLEGPTARLIPLEGPPDGSDPGDIEFDDGEPTDDEDEFDLSLEEVELHGPELSLD